MHGHGHDKASPGVDNNYPNINRMSLYMDINYPGITERVQVWIARIWVWFAGVRVWIARVGSCICLLRVLEAILR